MTLVGPEKKQKALRPLVPSLRVPTSFPHYPLASALRLLVVPPPPPPVLVLIKVIVAARRALHQNFLLRRRLRRKRALHSRLPCRAAPCRSPTACLIAPQSLAPFSDSASRLTVREDPPLAPDRVSTLVPCHDAYIIRFWSTQRPADDRPLPTASEPILPSTHGTTLSSFVARAHDSMHGRLRRDSFYKYKSGHSRRASQARRNSAESHTRSRTGSPQRSPSPSRGVLPLRSLLGRFSPLGRAQSREDPFIPVDPFRLHGRVSLNPFSRCFGARRRPADEEVASPRPGGSSLDLPPCGTCACVSLLGSARFHNVHLLAFDTFPRQLYLHMHLRLPSLYFSRVALIFEDAAVSRPEIQKIIDAVEGGETENVQGRSRTVGLPFPEEWVPPNVSPALARFKRSWENFVDSLVKEWKTLNVLSALLLSCSIFVFRAHINPLTFYVPTQSYFDVVSNT